MMESTNKWFWIVVIVLFIGGWGESEGCLELERVALLQLKSFFNDPNDYLRDWVDVKGSNCCEWERVKCSITSRRIIQISLNDTRQGQRGRYEYLNASLFFPFTEVNSLYLTRNNIAGFVDNEGLAKVVGSALKKLEILELSENYNMNESMLSSLSEISSLKSLYLGWNGLRGSDGFKWLSRLSNLETLDLSGNKLKNNILLDVGALSSVTTLNLALNFLEGSLHIKELNRMKNLRNLDVSYNYLDNNILEVVTGISNLKSLNLGSNPQLKVSIIKIQELGSLRKLEYVNLDSLFSNETVSLLQVIETFPSVKTFSLNYNSLNKTISTTQELNFSSNVEEISIYGSYLSDNILQSIGALTSLKRLAFSNSWLTGPLPTKGWCDLWKLEELDLSGNALEGSIPPCFHNLTSLHLLDISDNHIEVPSSFISFTNHSHLKLLFIDQNQLVREPTFQTRTENPKFQLKLLSMSNCSSKGLPNKQLPTFLPYQYDLRYVDLSYNNFGGENPSWLIENNTRLQQFLMAGNSFNGSLQLPKHGNVEMTEVDMSGNKMEGQIPMNICSTFPHLEHLFLSQNAFEGNIPQCLGGLKSLLSLDLSFNNFSGGRILEDLGESNSLWILRLSNNNLSGKIPPTIFSSSTLAQLYLDGNNFDGELPLIDTSTVSSSYLSDIDLSNNHLSGKLPTWIWNVSSLQTLVFSNNHFDSDHIPHELCNLGLLKFLDLSRDNFFGSVPSCFSSLTRLEHLYLSRNKLSGPLPRELYNSSSLVTLDLSHNNFTGKIPNWISTLSALRILILKANHFEGEIPSQICQLSSLSIIDLSQNKLFGPIPSCLSNLTLEPTDAKSFRISNGMSASTITVKFGLGTRHIYPLSYVEEQVAFTTKKGLQTYSGNILDYMSGIDLSCNMLSGQIPPELGNLIELHSLNLSQNELVGFIPSTFSKLKQVESLDISHNKLSGRIPIQLMELNSLAVFNVSYNNLSGSIPHEKAQFATFDESSYLGNPLLCGPPKNGSCTPTTPNASNDEEESGFLDKQVFYVTFVVSYTVVLMTIGAVLYINPYWRGTWFHLIGQYSDTCYYFIVDNVLGLSMFKRRS